MSKDTNPKIFGNKELSNVPSLVADYLTLVASSPLRVRDHLEVA
jgi:hypothetical protein